MRFYTTATNSRGHEAKAGAHKGQTVHARGWDSGVRVVSRIDENGKDVFHIYSTGGTNGEKSDKPIGTVIDGIFKPGKD